MNHITHFDQYLSQLIPSKIRERELRFNELELSKLSPSQIYSELMFPISPVKSASSGSHYMLPVNGRTLKVGTILWRGRRLDENDHILPLRDMQKPEDAWEPPAKNTISAGRLNKSGESLLYTSYGDPLAIPDEIRLIDNKWFSLIKYEVIRETNLTAIGLPVDTTHLSAKATRGANALSDYLGRQFTKKALTADGSEYALSELIAKYNFDLPPAIHHGWVYPSVEHPGSLNVTFRPEEAHSRLRLVGVCICKAFRDTEQIVLSAIAFSNAGSSDNTFHWNSLGTPTQTECFPEFDTPGIKEQSH